MEIKLENKRLKALSPFFYRSITLITITYFLCYLLWRASSTLDPRYWFFSWVFLAAEAFGVFTYILFAWITQDISPTRSYKKPVPNLKVDIFVPTYNEDAEILKATLTGCMKVSYPHTTYVLDDGDRAEIRELALRMKANYISRTQHDHAKAGNINHALNYTRGEFIVVLDADMVPQPDLLDRTLGYFEDESLAFVQLPQEFYNLDSIQHDPHKPDWHEQALFFRVIQPGKNHSNSAFWCGSPSVIRREALFDVGGVATETITEDIHTSVRLHSHGWTSYYLNEPLAFGIAPQTIKAFLLQRLRWAQGTMQLYRSKDNPIWIPGLTWRQRLSYATSFLAYFESFQKLILIATPILILVLNIFPMRVSVNDFLIAWIPYFALNLLANQVNGRGKFRYFLTEKFNILKMIVFIEASFTLVNKKPLRFKVTPKTVDASVYQQERQALRGFMVILGMLTGSVLYGLLRMTTWQQSWLQAEELLLAAFWACYNAYIVLSAIVEILQKRHRRRNYRFPVRLMGRFFDGTGTQEALPVRILDLSITGAAFILNERELPGLQAPSMQIDIPHMGNILMPIDKMHMRFNNRTGQIIVGVEFGKGWDVQVEKLYEYLYIFLPRMYSTHALHKSPGILATFYQDLLQQFITGARRTPVTATSDPVTE